MREILFRGKWRDNGEWVVGGLLLLSKPITFAEITYQREWEEGKFYIVRAEVDPATVGQYTGLTDKNGKKIFEGDIVEKHGRRMYVVEHKGSWMLWDYDENENFLSNWCSAHYFNGENIGGCIVVGNIHDNPELLKGGADDV